MVISVAILIFCTLVALYLLAGYPVLLARVKFRTRPAVQKSMDYQPGVTALITVHNGEVFLREKLNSLLAQNYPADKLSILVVSDGSTDQTASIAREYGRYSVELLELPRGGKAASLSAGISRVRSPIILFTDVRQVFDRDAVAHLAANFADPTVGAVTGELAFADDSGHGEQAAMDVYWRYELWVRRRHSEIDSLFNTTGAIYAARRELVQPIPADTLTDDAVIPLRIFFQNYRVIFDPEAVAWDRRTVSNTEYGRKLRTLAGLWQVYARMPELFSSRNRMRLHFLSHKFGRLMLPWAIVGIIGASAALPDENWRMFFLANELALLGLAAAAPLIPEGLRIKRLFSAARAFVSMNVAALVSMTIFVRPPKTFWAAPTNQVLKTEKSSLSDDGDDVVPAERSSAEITRRKT